VKKQWFLAKPGHHLQISAEMKLANLMIRSLNHPLLLSNTVTWFHPIIDDVRECPDY
jgi:hypothetical protein